jgi:glycosyltransferase involved in cell wall biosynthesis
MRRIALVVFGDPFLLPPTLNAAHVLAGRGWQVDLFGLKWRSGPRLEEPQREGVHVRVFGEVGMGAEYPFKYAQFSAWVCGHALAARYPWVIAYDLMAAPLGRWMARLAGGRFIFDSHDTSLVDGLSDLQRWLRCREREMAAARVADAVVFPQVERARRYAAAARLPREPYVVFNCPPDDWCDNLLHPDPRVVAFKRRYPRLVVYQGGLNSDRGVGALIDSLPFWPAESGLVLVGDTTTREVPALRRRAEELRVGERILWTGTVRYRALPAITREANLGVLITPGTNFNLRFLAGASNKIFEYMACGLPVLAPDTPGFAELVAEPGHGLICRDASPRPLALQITQFLDGGADIEAMRRRNVEAFRSHFNYAHQLGPVIRLLES